MLEGTSQSITSTTTAITCCGSVYVRTYYYRQPADDTLSILTDNRFDTVKYRDTKIRQITQSDFFFLE